MPKVTNTARSERQLMRFAKKPSKETVFSGNAIERVSIAPGAEVEVEASFLETEGAKALIECGDLVVAGGKVKGKAKGGEKPADAAEGTGGDS